MTGIRAILRDSPAGQLCRLYLGLKISPYADEKEGFVVAPEPVAVDEVPDRDMPHDSEKDDASEKDSPEKNTSEKDVEQNAPQNLTQSEPKHDPNAVEWSGPTDPDNPQNWSTAKKTFVFGQICLLTFTSK
jgi:hypothetical protein